MIDKARFVAELERAALLMPDLPVSAALLKRLAVELKKGEPPWWLKAIAVLGKRPFPSWHLFLACIHYEALRSADNPLVDYLPSCGGTAEADPSAALAEFLAEPPASFYENLRTCQQRAYYDFLAPLWIPPAMLFFQRRGLPYYLVEFNAGAGLNLAADITAKRQEFDSSLVAARIGLDPIPLELEDIDHRRWLTACLPPEHMPTIALLDKAIEIVQERMRSEAAFIQLAKCATALAPRFAAKNIPPEEEVGLLLFNVHTTALMDDAAYAAFEKAVMETLRPWGDRGLWVEVEPVRGELHSTTREQRAARWRGGAFERRVLARFEFEQGRTIKDWPENERFLSP